MAYYLVKSLHLLFVMAWMGGVFYLPRILVNIAEDGGTTAVRDRLVLMGTRLYKFGHVMFGIAFGLGMLLWLGFGMRGGWLHAKLALVVLMLAYYVVSGRLLKTVAAGGPSKPVVWLRVFNEVPVLLLLGIVFLVIAKPF